MTDILPRNLDAEKYVIGCLVRFPERADEIFTRLTATDFFDAEHTKIFRVAQKQFAAGGIDPVLLASEVGAAQTLVELGLNPANAPATAVHIPSEAAKIVECRRKRQLHSMFNDAALATLNGRPSEEIFRTVLGDMADFGREKVSASEPRFRLYSAAELDRAEFPENYLVERILCANEPLALGGAEKSLKTTIMVQMGIALAVRQPFLGVFQVPESKRFLMLSGESSMRTIQETARRMCRSIGYELGDVDNLTISPDLPQLDNLDDVIEFEAIVADNLPDVVGIDPMMLCLGDIDERAANMFSMGKLLRRLNEACVKHNATLTFAHHTSGPPQYGATPKLSWLAFAGFKQFVRQWVLLNRMEEYEPGSGFHRLKMVAGGSSGHNGLWIVEINEGNRDLPGGRIWECAVRREDEVRQETKKRREQEKADEESQKLNQERWAVIEVLRKHPEGLAKTRMLQKAKIGHRRLGLVFEALIDNGDIVECEMLTGNHKQPKIGYKLAGGTND